MAAIFKYSTATIYNVSLPPQKLEFINLVRQEWLKKETMNVCLFYAHILICDNVLEFCLAGRYNIVVTHF